MAALAPDFATLMLARAIAAAAHGCYFGLAILLGTSIVPRERRGMALAIIVGGINVANIVGVPLGTAVGNAFGWRSAFVMVGVIALAAFVAIAIFAPNPARSSHAGSSLAAQWRAVRTPKVPTSYAMVVLHMTAFWALSTFIAPYFLETGGVGEDLLPFILFAFGIAGGLGIVAGGRYADRYPISGITRTYPILAACFLVVWLGTPLWWPVGVLGLSAVWAVGSITVICLQNRILTGAAAAPELASSLISAVFNLGIAAGAAVGAQALAGGMAVSSLPLIGTVFLVAASLLAVAATRGEARR
jgi:DHA1 family inner membrane transport protein